MDTHQLTAIHQVLLCVTDTVGMLTFPRCDQDNVFELIDRVEAELRAEHPDTQVIATSLNSIAWSLRNQPEAREACLRIEDVIAEAGNDPSPDNDPDINGSGYRSPPTG